MNDVISVHGGYKQYNLSIDDFLNNVHCFNVNALSSFIPVSMQNGLPTSEFCKGTPVLLWHNIFNIMMHRKHGLALNVFLFYYGNALFKFPNFVCLPTNTVYNNDQV